MTPRLLDLFSVDINSQPNYPFEFWQADALEVLEAGKVAHHLLDDFDAIHASPPCLFEANWNLQPPVWGCRHKIWGPRFGDELELEGWEIAVRAGLERNVIRRSHRRTR